MRYIDNVHSYGAHVILQSYTSDNTAAEYNLAGTSSSATARDLVSTSVGTLPDQWWSGYDRTSAKPGAPATPGTACGGGTSPADLCSERAGRIGEDALARYQREDHVRHNRHERHARPRSGRGPANVTPPQR